MLHPNEVKLDSSKYTLLLSLNKQDLKNRLDFLREAAQKPGLTEKDELHITIIGFGAGKLIQTHLESLTKEERAYHEEELRELIRETSWNFTIDKQKAFSVQKEYSAQKDSGKDDIRYSIIQMIELPAKDVFYSRLNELFGLSLETPPLHITLFVGGTDSQKSPMGIGIDSRKTWEELNPQELR